MPNTKIVATLGPASDSPAVLRGLLEAGADVFRLNASHGTQEKHAEPSNAKPVAVSNCRPVAATVSNFEPVDGALVR